MQRFLERSAERRPSMLSSVGLSALQVLSMNRSDSGNEGLPVPVTVVFTDLEGFTRFNSEHGDEAAVALLTEHQRAAGPVIRSRGGRIVKRLGDGLMIAFPEPEAARAGGGGAARARRRTRCACGPGSTSARPSSPATTCWVTS